MEAHYAICARITRGRPNSSEWSATRRLPVFYLNAGMQGIVDSDHAATIARSILDPFGEEADGLEIDAVNVEGI